MLPRHSAASGSRGGVRSPRLLFCLAAVAVLVLLLQLSRREPATQPALAPVGSPQQLALLQQQQQQPQPSSGAKDGLLLAASPQPAAYNHSTAADAPPYRLPRLIHQTVVNKSRLSCEERRVIASWKRLNPGWRHVLWDDAEMRAFVAEHYPELLPLPYDGLLSGTERSDIWRVLVLHKLGGVYADMDVECLQPVDSWNAAHNHDAALLLGLENYSATRKPRRMHVTNWAMAAAPGHPLLGAFPGVVGRAIQEQFFAAAATERPLTRKAYEAGILDRTGPSALSRALYEYAASLGLDLNTKSERDVNSRRGLAVGGVRLLPVPALATGWKVADARKKGQRYTCADAGRDDRRALVCHMFWGSWRASWSHRTRLTYNETC